MSIRARILEWARRNGIVKDPTTLPPKVIDLHPRPDSRPYVKVLNGYAGFLNYPDSFNVYVEPWGNDYTLLKDEYLTLHSNTVGTGEISVHFVPDGIVVWFEGDDEPRIFNKAGQELSL